MLQALGMKFRDIAGNLLGYGGEILQKIEMIDSNDFPEDKLAKCTFTIACDVNNPFSGPQGAAFIFAPQKGADAKQIRILDTGLKHFAQLIAQTLYKDIDAIPGAGAAGGMGAVLWPSSTLGYPGELTLYWMLSILMRNYKEPIL